MANFIDDDVTLSGPKVNQRVVAPGLENSSFRAEDYNALRDALIDARQAILDLRDAAEGEEDEGGSTDFLAYQATPDDLGDSDGTFALLETPSLTFETGKRVLFSATASYRVDFDIDVIAYGELVISYDTGKSTIIVAKAALSSVLVTPSTGGDGFGSLACQGVLTGDGVARIYDLALTITPNGGGTLGNAELLNGALTILSGDAL